jgi:hypothetical protein
VTDKQPVLHLENRQIQKHRIDKPKLLDILEQWKAEQATTPTVDAPASDRV